MPAKRRRERLGEGPDLSDVARAAGVSTASASRALTRPGLVSDAVRERVRYAAATLGYVANPAARSLSTRRSGTVGIVVGDLAIAVDVAALEAAEARLASRGWGVLLAVAGDHRMVEDCARVLAARGVEGVLFIGPGATPESTLWCSRRAIPSVSIGASGVSASTPAAEGDARSRGRLLVRAYLGECDHLRIGVIDRFQEEGGPEAPSEPAVVARRVERIHDLAAMHAAIRELLESEVTALCLPDDGAAAVALRACRTMELAVPEDISIIGWGDSALARCLSPTLSSLRLPATEMGGAGVDHLLAMIAGERYASPELAVKLVVRESSGFAAR